MAWSDKARAAAAAARRAKSRQSQDKKAFWQVRKHINAGGATVARLEGKSKQAFSRYRKADRAVDSAFGKLSSVSPSGKFKLQKSYSGRVIKRK